MVRLLSALLLAPLSLAAPVPKTIARDRVVSNPADDIHIVTDRNESAKDYFNRTRVVVGMAMVRKGTADKPGLTDVLEATDTVERFVHSPSPNDAEGQRRGGEHLAIAPPSPAVADLLKGVEGQGAAYLIFRKGGDGRHHLVGYTHRGRVPFFGDETVNTADGYSLKGLRYVGEGR